MSSSVSPDRRPLLHNLSFHFLWSSTFASGFADRLAMLSVAVLLGQGVQDDLVEKIRLGDAAIIAAINFWFFLPYVLWGPFAGWLADRIPRKWLMFVSDEARGLLILGAFFLLPDGRTGFSADIYDTWMTFDVLGQTVTLAYTWKIWIMFLLIGLFAATFSPARNSVIPNVVGYRHLQRANSVVLGMGVIGNLVGFPAGGFLSEEFLPACILASAIAYLLPGWMWPFLKTPVKRRDSRPKPKAGPLSPLIETHRGALYVLRHRPVLALTGVSVLFWTGSQLIMATASAIAVDLYGGTIEDFAMIGGAFGVGMLAGAILLGVVNSRVGSELIIIVGMLGAGVLLSLLALVPNLYAGMVIALVMGTFGGLIMIGINTTIQQLTADCYRGRVMGFKDVASDLGGVSISLFIWMTNDDSDVIVLAHVFAALMIVAAAFGFFHFVRTGPIHTSTLNVIWRINRLYCQAFHRARYLGRHHIPNAGGALLVANHASGIDPMLIQAPVQRRIRWMMAQDMMVGLFGWFWRRMEIIPVDTKASDRKAARHAVDALRAGDLVAIFPEGGLNREGGLTKQFRAGVGLIASRADVPIVPVLVTGTPDAPSAYASVYRFSRSKVVFGKPVTVDELLADHQGPGKHEAIADRLRQRIEALAEQLND